MLTAAKLLSPSLGRPELRMAVPYALFFTADVFF